MILFGCWIVLLVVFGEGIWFDQFGFVDYFELVVFLCFVDVGFVLQVMVFVDFDVVFGCGFEFDVG